MESSEKRALKICLMVEHIDRTKEMPANTVYMIEPPTDAADYDAKQIDSDGFFMDAISPVVTIHNDDDLLLKHCAMVRLESRIYFFGGISDIYDYDIHSNINHPHPLADELKLAVRFFDVDHPELGLRSAASLRAPKEIPCVFSARGMIYALGSSRKVCNSTFDHLDDDDGTRVCCSGIFERYDPRDDQWKLLPDPPLPFGEMTRFGVTYCDSATLIADRYVFIGNTLPKVFLIFDLDQLKWSSLPPFSLLATQFPYGSLCVDNSLYYLVGYGSDKPGTQWDTRSNWLDQKEAEDEDYDGYDDYDAVNLQIVKRGPLLLLADDDDDPSKLVNSLCLRTRYNKQVMTRLYQVPFLLGLNCSEWRDIFHLGGRFFCCVVTSQLFSSRNLNRSQPYCRGVWIDVLEEVELPASKSTEFRTLASFPYRIRTPFKNRGIYIRCCAFGSVPDSLVKEPLKKKQVAKVRETFKAAEQIQHGCKGQEDCNLEGNVAAFVKEPLTKMQVAKERKTFNAEQIQHDHGGGSKGQGDFSLEEIVAAVAAGDGEIVRLIRAELAEKEAGLAKKEAELAKKEAVLAKKEAELANKDLLLKIH